MGRLSSEAECRIQQARVYVSRGQSADALTALNAIPLHGDRTVGKETQAQVHYWRGRAIAERDPVAARAEATEARRLIAEVQASLPPAYRDPFGARASIHQVTKP
jgi:hypothetical protein